MLKLKLEPTTADETESPTATAPTPRWHMDNKLAATICLLLEVCELVGRAGPRSSSEATVTTYILRVRRLIHGHVLLPCSDRKVIEKQEPLLVQPPSENRTDELLGILWTIGRSEGKAPGKVRARGNQYCHLLRSLFLVINMIEALLQVTDRDPSRSGYCSLDVVAIRNE